jgi:site-specific DNA recombinase
MGSIVFQQLPAHGVSVIDVMTQTPSDAPHARMLFTSLGMGNDQFLQMVKAETHRGLEGRALTGFWTGGRVFGFSTIGEPNPPDPEHPRKLPVINEDQAAVVRRVFALYRDGSGFRQIAAELNRMGVQAPYDGRRKLKTVGEGWPPSTVRSMLCNERYIGVFRWNRRQFIRTGARKNRVPRLRPEAEVKTFEKPELAIVDRDLWNAVQARMGRRKKSTSRRTGRPPGTGQHVYLLGGLTRCATCDGGMSVVSQQCKNGVRYVQFGCNRHWTRGDAVCPNNLTVSEKLLTGRVVDALSKLLRRPDLAKKFYAYFREQLAAEMTRVASDDDARRFDQQVAAAEQRVKNVTAAIAKLGLDDTLTQQLDAEKQQLQAAREQRAALLTRDTRTKVVPHASVIERYLRDLVTTLSSDPQQARELLQRHLETVVLTQIGEGGERHYHASTAFNLSACLRRGGNPRDATTPVLGGTEVAGKSSCGGRI